MSDASYQPKIYRKQGGAELVVASSGTLTVESGGAIANKGTITNSSAGLIANTQVAYAAASTGASGNIVPYGDALIGSTAAGALAIKIRKPGATGRRMTLICKSSTGGLTVVPATGTYACKFLGNAAKSKITFGANADGAAIDLVAVTSTNWSIVGYSTAWTTTVKCT